MVTVQTLKQITRFVICPLGETIISILVVESFRKGSNIVALPFSHYDIDLRGQGIKDFPYRIRHFVRRGDR